MPPPFRHPTPRFQGAPTPWMDGYGPHYGPPPRPLPPPPEANYPRGPSSSGAFAPPPPPSWESGPPIYEEYRSPPPAPTNPYFDGYQPSWTRNSTSDEDSFGPAKSRPVANRVTPYEKPDRFHYFKSPDLVPNNEKERDGNLFPSTALPLPTPLKRSSDNFVFVRGLPFHVCEADIEQFFNSPNTNVKPTSVKLILDDYSRPTEAKVEFSSHQDAVKAMNKDKTMLCMFSKFSNISFKYFFL